MQGVIEDLLGQAQVDGPALAMSTPDGHVVVAKRVSTYVWSNPKLDRILGLTSNFFLTFFIFFYLFENCSVKFSVICLTKSPEL